MSVREVIVPLGVRPQPRDSLMRPMRDLRISVMDRCNFRCPYCMPRETFHEEYRFLGTQERLSFAEIVRLEQDDWGRLWAQPCPTNGSGDFTALGGTDGFVELPPGPNTYPKGFVTRLFRWS